MKRSHRRLLNLCAFALLAFAFYLTFIKKDPPAFTPAQIEAAANIPATPTGEFQKVIASASMQSALTHK